MKGPMTTGLSSVLRSILTRAGARAANEGSGRCDVSALIKMLLAESYLVRTSLQHGTLGLEFIRQVSAIGSGSDAGYTCNPHELFAALTEQGRLADSPLLDEGHLLMALVTRNDAGLADLLAVNNISYDTLVHAIATTREILGNADGRAADSALEKIDDVELLQRAKVALVRHGEIDAAAEVNGAIRRIVARE
jgi:hypothetical protein